MSALALAAHHGPVSTFCGMTPGELMFAGVFTLAAGWVYTWAKKRSGK